MNKTTMVNGIWWCSVIPDIKVPGRLNVDSDKIRLEIHGLLGEQDDLRSNSAMTLFGYDQSGNKWTLLGAYEARANFGACCYQEITATAAVCGVFIESPEKAMVKAVSVHVQDLDQSVGRENKILRSLETDGKCTVSWDSPHIHDIQCSENLTVREFSAYSNHHPERYAFQLEKTVVLQLRFEVPVPFTVAEAKQLHLINLLTMLHAAPAYIETLKYIIEDPELGAVDASVFVLNKFEQRRCENFLVQLDDLSLPVKNQIFSKWFGLSEQGKLATNVFCSLFGRPGPFNQVDFVLHMQAFEAFHRSKDTGEFMSSKDFKKNVQPVIERSLMGLVTTEHLAAILDSYQFASRFTQRDRMEKLLELVPKSLLSMVAADPPDMIRRLVVTRNYLTHLDEKYQEKALAPDQVVFANRGLQVLFILIVLIDLGVPEDILIKGLGGCPVFRTFKKSPPWAI